MNQTEQIVRMYLSRKTEGLNLKLGIRPYCCPCCRKGMAASNATFNRHHIAANGKPRRTRGHLLPSSRTEGYRYFIYQCAICNRDQRDMSFYFWLRYLIWKRDPRAEYVFQTLMALLELGLQPKELQ